MSASRGQEPEFAGIIRALENRRYRLALWRVDALLSHPEGLNAGLRAELEALRDRLGDRVRPLPEVLSEPCDPGWWAVYNAAASARRSGDISSATTIIEVVLRHASELGVLQRSAFEGLQEICAEPGRQDATLRAGSS